MAEVRWNKGKRTLVSEIPVGHFFDWHNEVTVYFRGSTHSTHMVTGVVTLNVEFIGPHARLRKGYVQMED